MIIVGSDTFVPGDCHDSNSSLLSHVTLLMIDSIVVPIYPIYSLLISFIENCSSYKALVDVIRCKLNFFKSCKIFLETFSM